MPEKCLRTLFNSMEQQAFLKMSTMRLCHPSDGSTSPEYKLLCFEPP